MEYNRKIDLILPWVAFAVLAIVGIWMVVANGKWWQTILPADFLPNSTLYYILWIVFLIIYPFLYILSLASAGSKGHRIALHCLFLAIAVFLLLWVIYLYHVKDVRMALIFMGISTILALALVVYLWVIQAWSRSAPTCGMALLFFIWLLLVWFLTSAAREEGLSSMFRTMRERFVATHEDNNEVSNINL